MSLERIKIATKSKRRWWEIFFRRWKEKNCKIASTTNKVI